jgi:hypothetical protein
MSSKKKVFAVVITTAALTVGSFGAATAATKAVRVSKSTKTTFTTVADAAATGKLGRGADLSALLSALVTKGTITQSQADAIIAAHTASRAAHEAARSIAKPVIADQLKLISDAIGIDTATITTRVKAGESLATIAGAKKDALIAALIADHTKRIDAAVTAGTLTAAQATTLKANLTTHVTELVNATPAPLFKGGKGVDMGGKGGSKGGRGHGGPMGAMPGAPTIPAPAATTAAN